MTQLSVKPSLNIVFAGTPDFAAQHLEALISSQHKVVAVYTQPDRPAGRGKKLQPSPVKQLAQEANIPVLQPLSLKDDAAQQELKSIDYDIMVVVAYGLILPKAVLDIPDLGCLNVHGSLLPAWRGAAPIQRSVWAGDDETGVTIMQMDVGLDTGDMLLKKSLPVTPQDTSASLYEKLAKLGPVALLETLENIRDITPEKQDDELATYAWKLDKSEGLLDWQQSAQQLERNIRAFNPWPGNWFEMDGKNIKVWHATVETASSNQAPGTIVSADKNGLKVQTGTDILNITSLQIPGKKPQSFSDILNGKANWFVTGERLGTQVTNSE